MAYKLFDIQSKAAKSGAKEIGAELVTLFIKRVGILPAERLGEVALRVGVHEEHPLPAMREGVSNLVRECCLTFSVGAASIADAIHGLLRPGKPNLFSWEAVGAAGGLTSKDLVCPSSLDFKPKGSGACFKTEDMWGQVLSINRFGSELSDRCLADIIDLPIPLAVSIHVQAMDKSKAVAFVKKRIAWMDKEIIDEQMSAVKKDYDFQILPSELKCSKEEAEDLLGHLQNRNQRLCVYTGLVYTYAPTREQLDDQVMQIVSTARRNSIEADALDFRQREGLNSVLPLGHNHVEVSRMMTAAQVAIQMPFATQELVQAGGGYYGQNKQSSNLVLCNRKRLASPMGFVAGKPGSGKSFSVKREIENTILAYPDDEVIILDPAGEYSPVVVANGGESIRFAPDSDTHLNPFDLADVAHQSPSARAGPRGAPYNGRRPVIRRYGGGAAERGGARAMVHSLKEAETRETLRCCHAN